MVTYRTYPAPTLRGNLTRVIAKLMKSKLKLDDARKFYRQGTVKYARTITGAEYYGRSIAIPLVSHVFNMNTVSYKSIITFLNKYIKDVTTDNFVYVFTDNTHNNEGRLITVKLDITVTTSPFSKKVGFDFAELLGAKYVYNLNTLNTIKTPDTYGLMKLSRYQIQVIGTHLADYKMPPIFESIVEYKDGFMSHDFIEFIRAKKKISIDRLSSTVSMSESKLISFLKKPNRDIGLYVEIMEAMGVPFLAMSDGELYRINNKKQEEDE